MELELKYRLILKNQYFFALALLFASTTSSHAQISAPLSIKDGNALMDVCKEVEKPTFSQMLNFAMCTGYLSGVVDSEDGAQAAIKNVGQQDKRSLRFCLDERVTNGQLRAVVLKFLEERPELRHLPATVVIQSALARSFTCKESN